MSYSFTNGEILYINQKVHTTTIRLQYDKVVTKNQAKIKSKINNQQLNKNNELEAITLASKFVFAADMHVYVSDFPSKASCIFTILCKFFDILRGFLLKSMHFFVSSSFT